MALSKAEKAERKVCAIAYLLSVCPVGSTITTRVIHTRRDRNGNFRRSCLFLIVHEGRITDISPDVARAINARFDEKHGGAVAEYDDGSVLICILARTLYGASSSLQWYKL